MHPNPGKNAGARVVGLPSLGTACAFFSLFRGFEFSGFQAESTAAHQYHVGVCFVQVAHLHRAPDLP